MACREKIQIYAIALIILVTALIVLDAISKQDCARINEKFLIDLTKRRVVDLKKSGNVVFKNYEIVSMKIPSDPLGQSSSASIVTDNNLRYTLVVYDDCYSKWFY